MFGMIFQVFKNMFLRNIIILNGQTLCYNYGKWYNYSQITWVSFDNHLIFFSIEKLNLLEQLRSYN